MRGLLLYNPNATRTGPDVADAAAQILRRDCKLDVEATKRRDHAAYLAAGAAHEGYEVVFALGGDGTLNEVLQGVVGTDVRLGVLPGGSTNVLARTLGVPNDALAAAAHVREVLASRGGRRMGVGLANGRYFAFCAGFGYDAEVVRMVERRARMKRTVRQATFLWCGVLAWARSSRIRSRIVLDDGSGRLDGLRAVVCCNSDPYTFLGPLAAHLCPDADADLGLDVLALESIALPRLLRVAQRAVRGRPLEDLPGAHVRHDVDRYEIRAPGPLPVHVDGDYLGDTDTLVLRSVRAAVDVVA